MRVTAFNKAVSKCSSLWKKSYALRDSRKGDIHTGRPEAGVSENTVMALCFWKRRVGLFMTLGRYSPLSTLSEYVLDWECLIKIKSPRCCLVLWAGKMIGLSECRAVIDQSEGRFINNLNCNNGTLEVQKVIHPAMGSWLSCKTWHGFSFTRPWPRDLPFIPESGSATRDALPLPPAKISYRSLGPILLTKHGTQAWLAHVTQPSFAMLRFCPPSELTILQKQGGQISTLASLLGQTQFPREAASCSSVGAAAAGHRQDTRHRSMQAQAARS